jgi:zinc protease
VKGFPSEIMASRGAAENAERDERTSASPRLRVSLILLATTLVILTPSLRAQDTPPPPGKPRPVHFPKASEKTLANGLRVVVIPKHDMPLAAARLLVKTGGAADPAGRAGLADMTASLMTKGTKTKSATEIAEAIEALGGSLESGASWDGSSVDVNVMANKLTKALTIVADVVKNPAFAGEELDRLREQNLDGLRVALRQPGALAGYVSTKVIFGGGPYGHPLGGTIESIEAMKRDDIARFHKQYYRPDNAILIVGGDVTPTAAFAAAEKLFGSWKVAGAKKSGAAGAAAASSTGKVVVVDMPDAGQAAVVEGRPGIRRVDPDFVTAEVANSVLGGGYSSRLNQEIRIKRGLSYGAGSRFEARRMAGPFIASTQTKNESAAEVAGIILDELAKLAKEPVTAEELAPRKAALIGDFGRNVETNGGLVSLIGAYALQGVKLDAINHYVEQVDAVAAEDVQRFAAKYLTPATINVVIVGDAKKFLDPLKKRFGTVEVIPLEKLDLNGKDLKK